MSNKLSLYTFEALQHDEDTCWDSFYPKLQKYCHFLSQNKWDGDDLAQEAMVKAMTYYSKEKITTALLNKIAYNYWLDLLRKRKKEELKNEQISEKGYQPIIDTISSVDLLTEKFTPQQAIIFFLKEAFQYQSKEIAKILSTSEMAVKASLHRANKRLENNSHELSSLDSFWEEEECEQLWNLFYDSLINQDPTVLIDAIPSITSINAGPKATVRKTIPFNASTPSSTLCMAA
jgi:RNA polymerase sigma factor (sigma-70 family)